MSKRHQAMDDFPTYTLYLNQAVLWPSTSSGAETRIAEMPPQYAASAHAKLLRWAGTVSGRVALNMNSASERISYVRQTTLARALEAVMLSKDPALTVVEKTLAKPSTPEEAVLLTVMEEIDLHYPDWPLRQKYSLANNIVARLVRDHQIL